MLILFLNSYLLLILIRINCLCINEPGSVLFCGSDDGYILVYRMWDLQEIHRINLVEHGAIISLALVLGKFIMLDFTNLT